MMLNGKAGNMMVRDQLPPKLQFVETLDDGSFHRQAELLPDRQQRQGR